MKEILAGFIILLFLVSGCEKSEISQFDLKGTLIGEVYTLNEFGVAIQDRSNVTIQLDGSDPLIYAITDSTGKYEIQDIPSGTYNLIIHKEGYGTNQFQGFQIVGGEEPLHLKFSLHENSKTTIENLSLEFLNQDQFIIKGIIYHNFIIEHWSQPALRYFIHTDSQPSVLNYVETGIIILNLQSGSEMTSTLNINRNHFPTGTTIYVMACGSDEYGSYYYYDIASNKYIYIGLGIPSNIASIIIP